MTSEPVAENPSPAPLPPVQPQPLPARISPAAVLRVAGGVLGLSLFLIVLWTAGRYFLDQRSRNGGEPAALAAALLEPEEAAPVPADVALPPYQAGALAFNGISRLISLHTDLPSRPRFEVITYTVVEGDTIFGIAEKFGLQPESVMNGNIYTLGDNPHFITPGLVLNILPMDGVYHKWSDGEGLNGVSRFYEVEPEEIINWPGNNLTVASVGDLSAPNIPAGTMLFVPGGKRAMESIASPRITRGNPGRAKYLGAGYCANAVTGITGSGTFVWPTTSSVISGYGYSGVHPAVDIGGAVGNPIYAADSGVVVYAGWSDLGYGYIIVLDHGNGWQTYYAHLSDIYVACGQGVGQGGTIGAMGSTGNSTGPHLHIELRHDEYGKVNPMDFLR